MTKDDLSMLLTQSQPGEKLTLGRDELASLFPPRLADGGLSDAGLRSAAQLAQKHNCDFSFDFGTGIATFTIRPTPHLLPAHFSAIGA
jgi:hypothetical protein